MDRYFYNDLNKPKYLFHGSPEKLSVIAPRQSHDANNNKDNIDNAVFLTSSFILASTYAFKDSIKRLSDNLNWNFNIGFDNNEVFIKMDNVIIDDNLEGYIYVTEYNDKYKNDNIQYKAYEDIKPIDVIKIKFKDFKRYIKFDNYVSLQEINNEDLEEINSNIKINKFIDKEPYVKELTSDNIINLTGQSGSGKSTYASNYFDSDNYLVIDTDEVFSDKRYNKSKGINRELGSYFRMRYEVLPSLSDDFDSIYEEILSYCKKYDKTLVIDCAQFHCIKDITKLKGTMIIIRTCINNCYERCINRYKLDHPDASKEELSSFMERKKAIFKWYKYSNEFIEKINSLRLKKGR